MAYLTCHTSGCENDGIPIEMDMTWTDDDGNVHDVDSAACGACGNAITDISDTAPAALDTTEG